MSGIKHKKRATVILVISVCIVASLSSLLPVENLFVSFSTPQTVFAYSQSGHIEDIIEGNDSCMVVSSSASNSFSATIFPKSETGYKIGTYFASEPILSEYKDGNRIELVRCRGTEDYYTTVFGIAANNSINISDNCGSDFRNIIFDNAGAEHKIFFAYSAIDHLGDGYYRRLTEKSSF